MHIPSWLYKLGAIGGFGGFAFLFQQVLKPLLSSFIDQRFRRHDQPVWDILIKPNMKLEHWSGGIPSYSRTEEIPYSIDHLAKTVGRSTSSIQATVHRLEKRGKVKERDGGWQRTN